MEPKRKHRKVLRTAFTRGANELEQLLSSPQVEVRLVKVSLDILQQKYEELKVLDSEIYDLLLEADASEEDLLAEMDGSDAYKKRSVDLTYRCEEVLAKENAERDDAATVTTEGNNSVSRTGRRKFKLPAIEFKKFDGNIRDWLPFWSQFKKVHDDLDIDLNDKVEYLIQATIPGSRARQLVESFPATGANYDKMIDCLKARFGREDLQIEVYVRELLKLIINNTNSGGKIELSLLYDRIETQLRALETLGITSDKYAAMLFPLIESCFPPDLLRIWQRLPVNDANKDQTSLENRLKSLMFFLKNEVENEQRVSLAEEGFGLRPSNVGRNSGRRIKNEVIKEHDFPPPTATGLMNYSVAKCIFCKNPHESASCFKAQKLTLEQKRNVLTKEGACFRCLKTGHQARTCRGRLKCVVCGKSHVTLMCPEVAGNRKNEQIEPADNKRRPSDNNDQVLTNGAGTHVFLQTLRVEMNGARGSRFVRALIDTGSQKTYVLKATAQVLGYTSKRQVNIVHGLFGGSEMEAKHECYDVRLSHEGYRCTFEALDQPVICSNVTPVFDGPWMEELTALNIRISDTLDAAPIELLIGSDIAGKLYTGRRHILACGLVAVETLLGWSLMGKIPLTMPRNLTMTTLSLFVKNASLTELWELDALGISDPSERKTREEMAMAAKNLFLETVTLDEEGRYEVRLPWLEGHPALPSNYSIAKKRLDNTLRKVKNDGLFESYDQVFKEWQEENIIEEVSEQRLADEAHYLPHRPVVKEGYATTKIRPVFDASAKEKDRPSLNQCLEKGLNLIEMIPTLLIRFRQNKIGVISDIRKAFLQISLHDTDRDFLRFLWIDTEGNQKIYRHRRVVFGVSSSPFLLGATIEYHLSEVLKKCASEDVPYSRKTILKLSKSFYVDNCVTSVPNEKDLNTFIKEASMLMADGKFDLRGWEYTHQVRDNTSCTSTHVLGLIWDTDSDTLSISPEGFINDIDDLLSKPVTKRLMLSLAQRVFDPIGYTCPVTLLPKILLQQTWEKQLGWDTPVDSAMENNFRLWIQELPCLFGIKIPRWIKGGLGETRKLTLHTFCDASKNAFSVVIFLRSVPSDEPDGTVFVNLLAAKSRVAPLRKLSIPRLELMAAVIAVRLYTVVKEGLESDVKSYFWSDSSTVISWIQRSEEWSTFVWNRVAEIRKIAPGTKWRHVPGTLNPADLPSRGCSATQLLQSKWWEGPRWLYESQDLWPQKYYDCDEEEINQEKKKKLLTTLVNCQRMTSSDWHLCYFSQYEKIVRMFAWIFRFVSNCRLGQEKVEGALSCGEINKAEVFVLKLVQSESFVGETDKKLCAFNTFKDIDGLIRIRSRISNRNDLERFRFPIVLPANHPIVRRLIYRTHIKSCHVGVQGLMSILRENYWILGGRRAVKSSIASCIVCKRYNAKPLDANTPPLPLDRVRQTVPFQVTGVDLAGPLYLKTGEKAWVCVFTCAVYRAVHFELCTSLSVDNFMQALRRFIARRGRPQTIYSDNGTNFVGTSNAFARLDFKKIAEGSCLERINWRFNPPTASWWGGFWERLIGILKQLLRKVLGRASLSYEELVTVICDCESVINSRPLTYMSTDSDELMPLTPMLFLRDLVEGGVPDCDKIDNSSLCKKMLHRQKLREDLRRRFRNEYLGQLMLCRKGKNCRRVTLGEVVLVGNDQDKRLDWPIGRVTELLPGKDGQVRLVKVTTTKGQFLRPIQRIYPLECMNTGSTAAAEELHQSEQPATPVDIDLPNESTKVHRMPMPNDDKCGSVAGVIKSRASEPKVVVTRSGRSSRVPKRYSS